MSKSPFHDIWIETIKQGFLDLLKVGSPAHIESQAHTLFMAGVDPEWIKAAMKNALIEQMGDFPLENWKRDFHSIYCQCDECKAPQQQGRKVKSGEQVEGEKQKPTTVIPASKPLKRLL